MTGSLNRLFRASVALFCVILAAGGCQSVDDGRIPSLAVNINVSPASVWQTYGVALYGSHRYFVPVLHEPAGFPYLEQSATGFGGVLLVCGTDVFSGEAGVPVAYDLACPVERSARVRVRMEVADPLPVARCPECGSTYAVVDRGGSPISGPAATDRYGLRRYECAPMQSGGYVIYNPR